MKVLSESEIEALQWTFDKSTAEQRASFIKAILSGPNREIDASQAVVFLACKEDISIADAANRLEGAVQSGAINIAGVR